MEQLKYIYTGPTIAEAFWPFKMLSVMKLNLMCKSDDLFILQDTMVLGRYVSC